MTSTRIEAEDYINSFDTTSGNAGVPYPVANPNPGGADIYTTGDASGYMLGNIRPGEWLDYNLSLPQTGTYNIVARVVSPKRLDHSIDLIIGGQTYTFDFSRTGSSWEVWEDVVIPNVSLNAGDQTMRLVMGSSRFNLNYIEFIPTTTSPSPTPTPAPEPGSIAFSTNSYMIDEDSGSATVMLNRVGGSDGQVTVDVVLSDGTAIALDDYNGALQTITFADGVTSQAVNIPIIDDSVDEPDETINLSLANPSSGATLGPTTQSVITILDNDDPVAPPAPSPSPVPPSPSPSPAPTPGEIIRVEAEDYTTYRDTTSGNAGGEYRTDDVDIYTTTDASGYTVAGIKAGEWLEQSVTVPESGDYTLAARVASPKSLSHSLTVTIGDQSSQFSFSRTGSSWEAWADITIADVPLVAGSQTLRMTMGSSKFSLNYVDIIPAGSEPSPSPTPGPSPVPTPVPTPTPTFDLGRVMPLGDSITDGFSTFRGGYRDRLEDLLTDNGIAFDFVGSLRNGPSSLSDRDHEGHSGLRLDEIADSATSWIEDQDPDVVLFMGGTNDMNQDFQINTAPERLSNLIDQILDAAPQSHVVVSTIPPTTKSWVQPRVDAYNAAIPGVVAEKIADGQSVSLVDNYSVLTTADLGDNLHPNQGGYNKMAQVWFDELLGLVQSSPTSAALPPITAAMPLSSVSVPSTQDIVSEPLVLETAQMNTLTLGTSVLALPESTSLGPESLEVAIAGPVADGVLG